MKPRCVRCGRRLSEWMVSDKDRTRCGNQWECAKRAREARKRGEIK